MSARRQELHLGLLRCITTCWWTEAMLHHKLYEREWLTNGRRSTRSILQWAPTMSRSKDKQGPGSGGSQPRAIFLTWTVPSSPRFPLTSNIAGQDTCITNLNQHRHNEIYDKKMFTHRRKQRRTTAVASVFTYLSALFLFFVSVLFFFFIIYFLPVNQSVYIFCSCISPCWLYLLFQWSSIKTSISVYPCLSHFPLLVSILFVCQSPTTTKLVADNR